MPALRASDRQRHPRKLREARADGTESGNNEGKGEVAKAKVKRFKSNADGRVTISVTNGVVFVIEPGEEVEADDPVVIAALEANPTTEEVKGKGGRK